MDSISGRYNGFAFIVILSYTARSDESGGSNSQEIVSWFHSDSYSSSCKKEPFFGAWMIEELRAHGYQMSPSTLYPLLHSMEAGGLLEKQERLVDKKIRKYYKITEKGNKILEEAHSKAYELFNEIKD